MADFNNILGANNTFIQAVELQSFQPTVKTQSFSGRSQVRTFGGQLFSMKITMPPLVEADLRKVYAFLVKQKGGFSSFTIRPHNLEQIGGTAATSENLAAGTYSKGATQVTTSGGNLFVPGDVFKFGTHDKTYMVTECSGSTLSFEPGLLVDVVGASDAIKSRTEYFMTVRLDGDTFSYKQGNEGFGTIEFDVVEAV